MAAGAEGEDGQETMPVKKEDSSSGNASRRFRERRGERYTFKGELGRGGLGKVVEAIDNDFGRDVAVKMMRPGVSGRETVDRFLREARVAGRLPHPNIVPIYEIGTLEKKGDGTPYFTMSRIMGRDLSRIIEAVENGEDDFPRRFSRARLLRIFQEVCNAISYAHDRGVIHRDLKPANVMVGDYGEVFVVDWGLAKVRRRPDSPDAASRQADSPDQRSPDQGGFAGGREGASRALDRQRRPLSEQDDHALTMEGDILGTPAYMPPEQADGRIEDIDEKSDIYSLGAILYELLTFRPPFEGATGLNVLANVLAGKLTPPSARASEIRKAMQQARRSPEAPLPESVPPELEEIVIKAMAKDKKDRYGSVDELNEDVQRFLEGEKERERKRVEAIQKVQEGREHFARFETMAGEIREEEKALAEELGKVRPWTPIEVKRPLWRRQDVLGRMREKRMEEFGNAEVAFAQAMSSDSSNPGGREGLCDLYLDRCLAAERRHEREETALYRNLLSRYDRTGRWLAEIEKPGFLALRTFTYPCDCLKPVIPDLPDAVSASAGHRKAEASADPSSRSDQDGREAEWRIEYGHEPVWPWREGRALPGESVEDDDRPVPEVRLCGSVSSEGRSGLFGQTDACRPEEIDGVEVWVSRIEERDRRMVPGPEWLAGETPLEKTALERGSYICLLRHPAYGEVRVPVHIDRDRTWEQEVNLYRTEEIPEGFRHVPGGPFMAGGEKAGGGDEHVLKTEEFFMARRPVTFGEYIAFLNEKATIDSVGACGRPPREEDASFAIHEKGEWRLPGGKEESLLGFRLTEGMPVMGISWFDALAFCAWKSRKDGRVYSLPHEEEWEKAARGVDGRVFPWGDEYEGTYSNTLGSLGESARLLECGDFPADESPYGIQDLAGNVYTWCLNAPARGFIGHRCVRGGSWSHAPLQARAGVRHGDVPSHADRNTGIRLVLRPSRPPAP